MTVVNGWTVLTPSSDSRLVYISSSGNDTNAAAVYGRGYYLPSDPEIGADPTQPVGAVAAYRNPQEALKKIRGNGAPEWVLFRRGDSFPNSIMDGNYTYWGGGGPSFGDPGIWRWAWTGSKFSYEAGEFRGRNASEPFVISAWGPVSEPRPVFPDGFAVRTNLWNTVIASLDIRGISFGNAPANGWQNTLVEDCRARDHGMLAIQGGGPLVNLTLRRCVITDGFNPNGHNSAPFNGLNEGARLTFEECVFDRNGYKENPDAPRTWTANHSSGLSVGPNPVGTGVQPWRTWFDRNWYLSGYAGRTLRLRGNIASRTGGGSEQMRSGGLAERNLFLFNHDSIMASGINTNPSPLIVKGNVHLHDDAMLPPGGYGMNNEVRATDGAYWDDNVYAHAHHYGQNGGGTLHILGFNTQTSVNGWRAVVQNNVVRSENPIKGWGIEDGNAFANNAADVRNNTIAIDNPPSWLGASPTATPRASDTIDGNLYFGNPNQNRFSRSYTGSPRSVAANTTFAQWQAAGYDPNGQMIADWAAFKSAAGWTDPDRDIVSYMQSIDPGYAPDEDVRVDFGCSGPLQDVPQFVRNVVPGTDAQKRQVARRFHAFVTFINRARENRKGAWDQQYTAEAVINYIRAGLNKTPITGVYDDRDLSVILSEYLEQHGPVASLVLTTQPAGGISGNPLSSQPVVTMRDASNLTVSTDNSTQVSVVIQSGTGGTLTGTTTVTVVNGVAIFTDLVLSGDPFQSYVLRFSISSPSLSIDSNNISVSSEVKVPVSIDIVTAPVGGFSDGLFTTQPVLVIKDIDNVVVSTDNTTVVTAAITGESGGILKGTLTQTASNGIVTFTDLKLFGDEEQTYTLSFNSVGIQGVTEQMTLIEYPVVVVAPTVSDLTAIRSDRYLGTVHSLDIMGEINKSELLSLRANKTKLVAVGHQNFIVNYRNTILRNRNTGYNIPEDWDLSWSIKSGPIATPNLIGPCFLWIKPEKFNVGTDGTKYNYLTDSSQISTFDNVFSAETDDTKALANYYGLNSFIPLNFDGVDDIYLDEEESGDFVIPTNIDFVFGFVVDTENVNTGNEGVVFSVGRENENGSFQVIIDESSASRKVKIQTQAGDVKQSISTLNNCYTQGESIAVVVSRVKDVFEISVNGVPETLSGTTMYDVIASGSGSFIGGVEDAVDDTKKKYLKHNIYEIVLLKEIIDKPITTVIVDQLEGYFAAKYGVVLPSGHAYKNNPFRASVITDIEPDVPAIPIPDVSCSTLSATSSQTSFEAAANTGTVTVDVENESCQWSVSKTGDWITINNGAGIGDGSFTFNISENTGSQRTGTIVVSSGTASPVFISITQTQPAAASSWTPDDLASAPRLWFDAEAGVYDAETGGSLITVSGTPVRRWEDQGGILNKDVTVASSNEARAPTWEASVLNGKPVLRFRDEFYGSPVGCALYASATNIYADDPSRLAFFVVARRNNQHNGTTGYGGGALLGVANYEPSLSMPLATSTTQAKNPTGYYLTRGVSSYHGEYSTGWNAQPLISPGTWFIYANFGHWDVATDGFYQTLRVNGGAYATTSPTKTPTEALGTGTRNLIIGGRFAATTDVWDGDIAEVIYCSGQDWASSTSDRDKIEGYLAHKWGLEGDLPIGHPYKTSPP